MSLTVLCTKLSCGQALTSWTQLDVVRRSSANMNVRVVRERVVDSLAHGRVHG